MHCIKYPFLWKYLINIRKTHFQYTTLSSNMIFPIIVKHSFMREPEDSYSRLKIMEENFDGCFKTINLITSFRLTRKYILKCYKSITKDDNSSYDCSTNWAMLFNSEINQIVFKKHQRPKVDILWLCCLNPLKNSQKWSMLRL